MSKKDYRARASNSSISWIKFEDRYPFSSQAGCVQRVSIDRGTLDTTIQCC